MRRLLATFVITITATGGLLFYQHNEEGFSELSSTAATPEEAPSSARSFNVLRLPPLPAVEKMPAFQSAEEAQNFIAPFHEREAYTWNPGYSVFLPAFDSHNRPFFRSNDRGQIVALESGFQNFDHQGHLNKNTFPVELLKSLYAPEVQDKVTASKQDILWDPKLAVFDAKDRVYSILRLNKNLGKTQSYVLMSSENFGQTWSALPLVGTADTSCVFKNIKSQECQAPELYDLERPYSKEPLPGPPSLLYHVSSGKLPGYEKAESWLGTKGRLYLQIISEDHGELKAEPPVLISDTAQEIGYRSGGAAKIIHSGSKYFLTWLEASPEFIPTKDTQGRVITPAVDKNNKPGSSVWVAEYDTASKLLTKQELLKTWPVNDSHNQPGIVRGIDGILHVIGGGHGAHLLYSHSLKADSVTEWSAPVPMNTADTGYKSRYSSPNWDGGSQTYISMVIDSKSQIHTLYRQWTHDKSIFDFEYFGALVYQKGIYDSKLKQTVWEKARILIYPNASEYTHWYQLMTLDRKDHLIVEYSNLRPSAPYFFKTHNGLSINTSPMLNSALLRSDDEGISWFFPTDGDFIKTIDQPQ